MLGVGCWEWAGHVLGVGFPEVGVRAAFLVAPGVPAHGPLRHTHARAHGMPRCGVRPAADIVRRSAARVSVFSAKRCLKSSTR